jgi:hypothetical protein
MIGWPILGMILEASGFIVEELWQSMKSKVELQRVKIRLNFLNSKDLTNHTTPGVFQQYKYFIGRQIIDYVCR